LGVTGHSPTCTRPSGWWCGGASAMRWRRCSICLYRSTPSFLWYSRSEGWWCWIIWSKLLGRIAEALGRSDDLGGIILTASLGGSTDLGRTDDLGTPIDTWYRFWLIVSACRIGLIIHGIHASIKILKWAYEPPLLCLQYLCSRRKEKNGFSM
jgi:hypothetical protein